MGAVAMARAGVAKGHAVGSRHQDTVGREIEEKIKNNMPTLNRDRFSVDLEAKLPDVGATDVSIPVCYGMTAVVVTFGDGSQPG